MPMISARQAVAGGRAPVTPIRTAASARAPARPHLAAVSVTNEATISDTAEPSRPTVMPVIPVIRWWRVGATGLTTADQMRRRNVDTMLPSTVGAPASTPTASTAPAAGGTTWAASSATAAPHSRWTEAARSPRTSAPRVCGRARRSARKRAVPTACQ